MTMEQWHVEEVCKFMSSHRFDDEVVDIFQKNKISGRVLMLKSTRNATLQRRSIWGPKVPRSPDR